MSANNDNNRFGNNIRALREAFGETQAESAKVVYVKRSNTRQPQGEHRHRTPAGKFMLTVFAALAQLEREQLKQRQHEGIEIAKAQGKYTGQKPIEIDRTRFGQLYGE